MKQFRFRIIIILLAVALSVYLLHFTYADYQNSKHLTEVEDATRKEILAKNPTISRTNLEKLVDAEIDSIKIANPSYASDRAKRIKLGLDLQGGMYMVMEVNTAKLLEKLATNPDQTFNQTLKEAENESKVSEADIVGLFTRKLQQKGVRLSRYFGSVRDDDDKIITKLSQQSEDAVKRAVEIIKNRVDQYGVSEPSIERQGSRRIIIQLPGVAKEEEARQLLQGSALLEFKLVKEPQFAVNIMQKIDEALAGKVTSDSLTNDSTKTAENKTADTNKAKNDTSKKQLSKEEFAKQHPFFAIAMLNPQGQTAEAYVKEDNKSRLEYMINRPEVQKVMPNNVEFKYSAKSITGEDGAKYFLLYMVNKNPELTGGVITDAQANIDPQTSSPVVYMQMNAEGARDWARITGSNIGNRIAIVLDNVIYSAPTVQNKIPNGNSQISGMRDLDEAKLMEIVLKAGALPAPVDFIEERTVGPSLGQDSVSKGFNSSLIGYILVAIFMIVYYQKAGTVTGFSLMFTVLFILAALAGFAATLTMPGIAGIVLAVGTAVDSNVLIFERIREELAVGKTIKSAIQSGFKSSFSAIFDSNVTTLITGIILYQFGSGPIQGFAITLMIGILASLFSSLVITRLVFEYMAEKGYNISIG